MKKINEMQFISNAIEQLAEYKREITNADSYEKAKKTAREALGYLNCLHTFNNTMICKENNEFTADFGDALTQQEASIYQALVTIAAKTGQAGEIILKLCQTRDEIQNSI